LDRNSVLRATISTWGIKAPSAEAAPQLSPVLPAGLVTSTTTTTAPNPLQFEGLGEEPGVISQQSTN